MEEVLLTKEQQEKVEKEWDKEEYFEKLQAARARIIQGIERNNNRSGERAIWELMQNASDLSDEAITKIVLSRSAITFSHQGKTFDRKTLNGLILQQSTKMSDSNSIGQYGTGFMTTHTFSRYVKISGDCCIVYDGNKKMYVPLPDGFCLDRTSDEETEFIKEMDHELTKVRDLLKAKGKSEPEPWTSFSYQLDPDKVNKIKSQLVITTKLMPFVLIFNDHIKECTIYNEIDGYVTKYTKSRRDSKGVGYSTDCFVTNYISVEHNDGSRIVQINSLESQDGHDRIIIPPLPIGLDNTSEIPSQFLFFPLLGSENFGINFIFHSDRIYPTEPRNSYQLPEDNDSLIPKYKKNESVLEEMFEMLFSYYRNNEDKQNIPLDFARVNFEYYGEDEKTKIFYDNLQKRFSEEFFSWRMIPTIQGMKAVGDGNVKLLHPEIFSGLNDELLEKYIHVITMYVSRSYLIPNQDIVEWSKVVNGWTNGDKGCFVQLEDICNNIKERNDDLKTFLLFLNDIGGKGTDLMMSKSLIPNREGELRNSLNLKNGKTITPLLYEIAKPILGNAVDVIVDPEYSGVASFTEYSRKDLCKDIKSSIDDLRKKTVDRQGYYGSSPSLLEDTSIGLNIQQLIKYCSMFPSINTNDFRARIMPIISDIYNVQYIKIENPQEDDEPDLYSSAFLFLLDNTMLMLSQKDSSWLTIDEHHDLNSERLFKFVSEYANTKDEIRLDKLNKYGIIPNQLGELCKAKSLKINASIDDELLMLYNRIFNKDLKEEFVDTRYNSLYEFDKYTKEDLGLEVERELSKRKYEGTEILNIIHHLYKGQWKDVFPNIDKQKEELFYQHGSAEDKENMYRIQMQGSKRMRKIANLIEYKNFDDILAKAENLICQQKEAERQFHFAYTIGKLIEDEIRYEINEALRCTTLSVDDIQSGQDIVIGYKGKDLYYIECKAKWNFNEPAHMSSIQIKKAVKEKERYALCCIDCTDTGCHVSYDATQDEVYAAHEEILDHTCVLMEIGSSLSPTISSLINHENNAADVEEYIRVYGNLSCNIPKKVFLSGKPFKFFMTFLKELLKEMIVSVENC